MTATLSRAAWASNFSQNAVEFDRTGLELISGQIPAALKGSLYRNGPGRLSRGREKVGHWFDGDGAILAVHFGEGRAEGQYRYVQTQGYTEEEEAGRYLYGNYGMVDPQGVWHYWKSLFSQNDVLKNAANTSVIALPDRLLALWEAGHPYALDLENLATLGREDFGGAFQPGQPFSAHPLRDPLTEEIFSIGVDFQFNLNLYRLDGRGNLLKHRRLKLSRTPFCHSFCLAGRYLILFLPPITLNQFSLLLGNVAYADALGWDAEGGTKVLVIDRQTLEIVSEGETESWFQWHYGNGCELEDGNVRLDFVRFSDFAQTNEYLREVPTGAVKTSTNGQLWQATLNPQTAKIVELTKVLDRSGEFPVVNPQRTGQPWRYTYMALQRPAEILGSQWFGEIARIDYHTGDVITAKLGEHQYPVEPLYIPHPDDGDRGWIITVVYDGDRHGSEMWLWDADRLQEEPICRLALPEVIPFSFHGTWRPA
ncbi:carotenoid oxygenase family protein [Synechocystis sp. LEGE 06083]|nr:carotenoid oxygenase family protein [Synechocystis sp. LEGE 06083]